ncbi:MAG: hypothetical protein M1814_002187 [Vezdaea aestivalis]|nr:MAG: hypothetical protein M1814_002187 [Vezdaea aestivalis]
MPPTEREPSSDGELVLKHQHSFADSTSSRASIPMWDSADPDRAPPPLPLNTASASPTRPNTSAAIASAAAVFTEKARESASSYTTNPLPSKRDVSPDKSLIRGHHHKRMQSLQTGSGSVRDLSLYLDNSGSRSPDRSLVLSSTPNSKDRKRESGSRSPDRTPTRAYSPTPFSKDTAREMPTMRPTTRPPPRSILGENTPPTSATMLAIQNMATPITLDAPLSSVTNSSTAISRTPQSFDGISSQILSLTSIATNLQREMAQLSRRSKDNATDLISLKEATNSRDEDIRKSLRELVTNLSSSVLNAKKESEARSAHGTTRSQSTPTGSNRAFLLDNKPHCDPPTRTYLPRIPSPNSFAASLERELAGSPSPYNMDGAASLALLEKILREMATKEGQQRLFSSLAERSSTNAGESPQTTRKLEEILELLKEKSGQLAMVDHKNKGPSTPAASNDPFNGDFESPKPSQLARTTRDVTPHPQPPTGGRTAYASPRAADFIGDEILKLLRKMKDSVTETGGMTSEIKALVRELRGEVLGMGRELGRKLEKEQAIAQQGTSKADLAKIVEDGLSDLREHMDRIVKDKRRQSSSSTISRSTVDSQEVYQAVKHALGETQALNSNTAPGLSKEEILDAIKDAWESYRPEIELQNFGLERDEILQCLKEGLDQHRPQRDDAGISRLEVLEAIQEGLEKFKAPTPETEASITRNELLLTVRECLENFDFPNSRQSSSRGLDSDLTHETIHDAVKEALSNFDFPSSHSLPQEMLSLAVKEAVQERGLPTDTGIGSQVLENLAEMLDELRNQFQGVSDEAKQNVAANGRDTEQVLDAVKDGLERLRSDIETYVDRTADVTGRDEIIDAVKLATEQITETMQSTRGVQSDDEAFQTVKDELEHLRTILATNFVNSGRSTSEDVVDAIREEFEHLRSRLPSDRDEESSTETITVMREEFEQLRTSITGTLVMPSSHGVQREEVAEAVRLGVEGLRADIEAIQQYQRRPESVSSNTSEILDAFNDGIDGLKADVEKLTHKAAEPSVSDEILDTLKEGLAEVRADLDALKTRPMSSSSATATATGSRALAPQEGEIVTADSLNRGDIENLEILMTQLRIKVESLDGTSAHADTAPADATAPGISREHFAAVEQVIREVQASVTDLHSREQERGGESVNKEDMDAIETLLINTKAKIDDVLVPAAELGAHKQHVEYVETVVKDTKEIVEDLALKLSSNSHRKDDVALLESLIKDLHLSVEEMKERAAQDYESGERPTKTDIDAVETICVDTKAHIEQLIIPHLESLPTKSNMDQIQEIIVGHKEHSSREAVEMIRMMEDRKTDHDALSKDVVSVKELMEQVKEELKARIEEGAQGIDDLGRLMDNLGETISSNNGASADIRELVETVQREFERAHGSFESIKLDNDDQTASVMQKQEEKATQLLMRLDERFDELMTKYDDAQLDSEAKQAAFEDSSAATHDILSSTRAVLDEVKLNTATLGTTFTDTSDRLGEDSKTVFNRVEDTYNKAELIHADSAAAHQATHESLHKVHQTIDGISSQARELQPKIFSSVKDILLIVGQHFEQSRRHTEEEATRSRAAAAIEPAPTVAPAAPSVQQILEREKYDDSQLHDKLDRVLQHLTDANGPAALAQMALLDQINSHVATTQSEMSQFVAAQAKLITEDHESKERQAEEAGLMLSKRLAEKDAVEADLLRMNSSKTDLTSTLTTLQTDIQSLSSQKSHLNADLASLETALRLRREELALMEARAETLERRILEGVIDHSRALLVSRPPRSNLGSDAMSLKRVGSIASSAAGGSALTGPSASSSIISARPSASTGIKALKREAVRQRLGHAKTPTASAGSKTASPASARRILSLSQITGNAAGGGDQNLSVAVAGGLTKGLSRSQSVRTHATPGGRKVSWGLKKTEGGKENDVIGEGEGDEEDEDRDEVASQDTTRRGSRTGRESLGTENLSGEESISDLPLESWQGSVVGTVGESEDGM